MISRAVEQAVAPDASIACFSAPVLEWPSLGAGEQQRWAELTSFMHTMYLSPEILDWHVEGQGSTIEEEELWKRAYEIWSHAESVLSNPTTDFLRVDAITTLKRSIDHRLRILKDFYSFRSIPIKEKPSDILGMLAFLGIVRPLMLQRLLDIRNAVEHQDANPPDNDTCLMFLEFTWYFLKSTDRLAQFVLLDFDLTSSAHDEEDYWLNVTFGPKENWIPKLRGWLTPNMISSLPKDDWLTLNVESAESRIQVAARLKGTGGAVKKNERGRGKNPDDVCIHGEVRGPSNSLMKMLRMYFTAA